MTVRAYTIGTKQKSHSFSTLTQTLVRAKHDQSDRGYHLIYAKSVYAARPTRYREWLTKITTVLA
jgi:hypothetical protein